jgi:hypothetical protein
MCLTDSYNLLKLSGKKQELSILYKELNDKRGFSEDCADSLLHQLICMLVELTSVPDSRVSRTVLVLYFYDF